MRQNPVRTAFEHIDTQASAAFRETLRAQLLADLVAPMSTGVESLQETIVTHTNDHPSTPARRGRALLGIAAAVIVAVGVSAVVINRNSADTQVVGDSLPGTDATGAPTTIPDSQPVTVTGEALAMFVPSDAIDPDVPNEVVDPEIGQPAPLISGFDFAGNPIAVDPAANGPYMIVFLTHWCPHCAVEIGRLLEWEASGMVPTDLNVLGVSTAVSPTSANYPAPFWFAGSGWPWPVMVDESQGDGVAGKAASAYGPYGWPYFVIIGADGSVKARFAGEIENSELQAVVEAALAA